MTEAGAIRVGIGGWTYAPWRGTFYPAGLPQARELSYAAQHLTAIEVNGTYYGRQKPATFATWAKAVPDGFKFSLKASRYCTNRRVLAEAGDAIRNFLDQGITELGDRLGPVLWQFAPTKMFDRDDMAAFVALLPTRHDGLPLRHALEPRHDSFRDPEFVAIARDAGVAIVFADSPVHPMIADQTADFAYVRLQDQREEEAAGYSATALDRWQAVAETWAAGGTPPTLRPVIDQPPPAGPRDVYMFMINGAKVRAPAAAMALIGRLQRAAI